MALKSVSQVTPAASPFNGNGWIFIQDSYYTVDRALLIPAGVKMGIPDDAEGVLSNRTYAPTSSVNWYDPTTSKLHPDSLGDFFLYRLNFTCEPAINNRTITVTFDIGTASAPFEENKVLARGAGTPTRVSMVIPITTGAGFFNNGGRILIACDCDLKVYKISIAALKAFKGPEA